MKCWLCHLASLLWAEDKFNCGITDLRKAEKMSMTMFALANIVTVKKMILNNRRITIREVADNVQFILNNFYRCFRHETYGREDCFKIAKFWTNIISGDESWAYGYVIETEAQSSQWKRPEGPKNRYKVQPTLTYEETNLV